VAIGQLVFASRRHNLTLTVLTEVLQVLHCAAKLEYRFKMTIKISEKSFNEPV